MEQMHGVDVSWMTQAGPKGILEFTSRPARNRRHGPQRLSTHMPNVLQRQGVEGSRKPMPSIVSHPRIVTDF